MAIADDILIDYTNKRIYQDHPYVAGTDTPYKTQELYSYIMGVMDDQAQMDNTVPTSAQTPNAFTMINGWFIDDETVKWLKDGALETSGWAHPTNPTGIRLLTLDATAGLSAADIGKEVKGGTTLDTGKLLAYDTTRKTLWVRCDAADDLFDDAAEAITVDTVACGNMTKVSETGDNLYVNVYTLGTLTSASDTIYVIQSDEKLPAWWDTGIDAFDVLIKAKEMGITIDGGDIIVFCRYYPTAGNAALYDHFPITLTAGRQAVPLATALDANNTSSQATVEDYVDGTTYTITFGFAGPYSRDLNNGAGSKDYDVEVVCDSAHLSEVYEAMKYVCREGSTTQLDGDNGEEYISANPASYAPVKQSPFGTFAGGKYFGARGIWITGYHSDDAQNFQLIASDNTTQNPPNTIVAKVSSVLAGDSVAMFALVSDGAAIEKDTYTLDGAHGAALTAVTVVEDIAGNWPKSATTQSPPASGYLRIVKTDGSEVLKKYTSWTGKVFTLDGTLGTACDSSDGVYIPIIDEAASGTSVENTLIQSEIIYVRTRVRKSGIIPFEIDGNVGTTGLTVPAIRTVDGIVS